MIVTRALRRFGAVTMTCAAAAAFAAGCGGDKKATTTAAAAAAPAAAPSGAVAESTKLADAGRTGFVGADGETGPLTPVTTWPGPTSSVKPVRDKQLQMISICQGACDLSGKLVAAVTKPWGWTSQIATGTTPQDFQTLTNTALTKKPDAVLFLGAPDLLFPQQLAKAAGQKIATLGVASAQHAKPGFTGYVSSRQDINYRMYAHEVIARSGGKADVALIYPSGFPDSAKYAKSFEATMKQCAGCKAQTTQVPNQDLFNPVKIGQRVTALLNANPKLDWIVFSDDSMNIAAAKQAVAATGRDVKLGSGDGSALGVGLVQNGTLEFDVADPTDWIAYASADQLLRAFTGKPPIGEAAWGGGVHTYTKDNLPSGKITDAAVQADLGKVFDYRSEYEKLWGAT